MIKNKISLEDKYKFHYEVGIFDKSFGKKPLPKSKGTKQFLKGEARKVSSKTSSVSIVETLKFAEEKDGILTKPFKDLDTKAKRSIGRILQDGLKADEDVISNTLSAIVIQPIAEGKYGSNKPSTIKTKGFNRKYIDTGAMVSNIKGKLIK